MLSRIKKYFSVKFCKCRSLEEVNREFIKDIIVPDSACFGALNNMDLYKLTYKCKNCGKIHTQEKAMEWWENAKGSYNIV